MTPPHTLRTRLNTLFHAEATTGVCLVLAAALALFWANSPWSDTYQRLWALPLSLQLGDWRLDTSLSFLINDGLMTLFFLMVGMEVRRELHQGSLSDPRAALLPVLAALGGVLMPALIYLGFNPQPPAAQGWAVPTATDIAFAVGVLALLGPRIHPGVRLFLLTLAIIDDVLAVLIIALFYSGGLHWEGLLPAATGLLLVLMMQRLGFQGAWAYVLPGALVWFGLLATGAHPTLAGVVLGLLTPVRDRDGLSRRLERLQQTLTSLPAARESERPALLGRLLREQRDLEPPAQRVPRFLHPWVAYGVMPLFALANAGIRVDTLDLRQPDALPVLVGVALALVLGKLGGVLLACWLALRSGLCRPAPGLDRAALIQVGLLAGIGFTMSVFIANLAFADPTLLTAAKAGILLASVCSALLGLAWGRWAGRAPSR